MEIQDAKQARPHCELIAELLDSRQPKTEREHAAVREIERLRTILPVELVRDALDHIMRVARSARRPTRRLDWIAERARRALDGQPYDQGDMPQYPKTRKDQP